MRIAVTQFATSSNIRDNLATCIRVIDEAAICKPDLIVLPEYSNTLFCHTQSCYHDHNQAWNEALSIDDDFLQRIAERAKKHNCYIVLGVTLKRDQLTELVSNKQSGSTKSKISVTSCLISPLGERIKEVDKHALLGYENNFFTAASKATSVLTTPFGKLGLLTGNDDLNFDASRELSLCGAQLLCHSMNSFALDQSSLHGPARACENKVFLAAANKVGSLIAPEFSKVNSAQAKSATFATQSDLNLEAFVGAGQSQILSPSGKVLAKIANNEEGFVYADINLADCSNKHNRFRPDGTELNQQRRPELYQKLTQSVQREPLHDVKNATPATANVAIFATYRPSEQAIEDVCHYIENNLSDIIQLPELFFLTEQEIINNAQHLGQIENLSKQLINQIASVLRPFQYVCTSLVIEGMHQAVLISEHGLFARQQQLHFCQRYQWTALGDYLNIIKLPLEQGQLTVAMLTADDANIAEIVQVAALNKIHLLLVPFDIQEPCEVEYNLLARAIENRICIVAASREKNFVKELPSSELTNENGTKSTRNKNKIKSRKSTGLIVNLTTDFAELPQWKPREFNGYINQPIATYQHGKITKAVIHPLAASNKHLS